MHNTIKVLHTEWSDGWGGQEIRIINEILAIKEKGIEVSLVCRNHAKIKEKAIEHGIEVFTLPFRGSFDFATFFGLKRIIKENKINIINTHSGKDTWVGGLAAKVSGIKFIRTRHLSNRIRASRLNFINELADYIFTTGESVKDNMVRFNRIDSAKIASIPTGIDDELFNPNNYDSNECRNLLRLNENELAIGIVAVIRGFKRHDLFIGAAERLLPQYPYLKFFIAGDGPRMESMIQLVKYKNLEQNIVFLGHVDEPAKILSALDIVTLTSDSNEGVPQSVMQALLMDKKVVATRSGSTSDLFNGNNFLLIDVNNLESIVDGLEKCIKKNDNILINRSFIVDNFSKKIMVTKIIKIYRKILALDV